MDNKGREIKSIWWTSANGDTAITTPEDHKLVCVEEYLGTYSIDWAVMYDATGKEIARHNLAFVASIVWK